MVPDERIACLWVPDLPLAALLRAEPDLAGAPVAVTAGEGARAPVLAATQTALAAGVVPGLTAVQARSLLPVLLIRGRCAAQVRSALAALVDLARAFSPRVEQTPAGEVWLGLGGLERLSGGERALGAALWQAARRAGLTARVGIGSSPLVAGLAARTADEVQRVEPGAERVFLAPLPLALLPASARVQATLARFGIERLGQLAALPPRGLGRRLGPEGLRLWRLSRGEGDRRLVGQPPPERFVEACDTGWPLERLEPLREVLRGVLERLSERLGWRGLNARGLELRLGLEPRGRDERSLPLAAASRRVATWLAVVCLSLEEKLPRAPVVGVEVEAQTVPGRGAQLNFFVSAGAAPEALDDALARLAALAGAERVGSPRLRDSHRPDAFDLVAFRSPAAPALPPGAPAVGRGSLRVFRPPWPVRVQQIAGRLTRVSGADFGGPVRQLAGPWRLDGVWWEEPPLRRDYYEVELGDGVYRLYREHEGGAWFVDGVWG